ncbi:hypothetical protein LCGC14_1497370 [marine sediment metagenome]|uniref:XRE family transcriptional regulator n=1 Tax=marine sediment metagenome TaxID=412755 RepID=A0A0F9J5N7_9ZZZZ
MINPNRNTSEEVLRRLKEASYERMRVELLNSLVLKMKDFDMSWDDLGHLLGWEPTGEMDIETRADRVKNHVIQGGLFLSELNELAHIFSCEPYIIFRPREPWTKT